MRSLIIGSRGFVGPHLEDYLKDQEHDVFEFDLKLGDDIRDYEQVRTALEKYQPDNIFHLAAMSNVGESNLDPTRATSTHIIGSYNILEAVRRLGIRPRIHLASTSEEYGYEHQTTTVIEESPTFPTTVYGITKNAMTNLARFYIDNYGMHIVVTRAFNHIGPGQGPQPVTAAWARQIVAIERGEADKLQHGNLETVRNFTDVRDIVRAYSMVINATPGIYNVCSKESLGMDQVLEELVSQSSKKIKTEVDQHLYKEVDATFLTPSFDKLHKATGWEPTIPFETSIADVLQNWRERAIL